MELFALETQINITASGGRDQACARDVNVKHKSFAMQTYVELPSATFQEIAGMVGRDTYVNDSVVHIRLQIICDVNRGTMLFQSHDSVGWPTIPKVDGHKTPIGDDEVLDLPTMRYLFFLQLSQELALIVKVNYIFGFRQSVHLRSFKRIKR